MKYLILVLAWAAFVRYVLASPVLMLGDDQVGYLLAVDAVKNGILTGGEGWRHATIGYYLLPLVTLLGEYQGGKVAAAIASVLPAIPLYLLLSRVSANKLIAGSIAFAFIWWPNYGAVLAYGFAYLFSINLALWALLLVLMYVERDYFEDYAFVRYLGGAIVLIVLLTFSNLSALLPFVGVLLTFGIVLLGTKYYNASPPILLVAAIPLIIVLLLPGFPVFQFETRGLVFAVAMIVLASCLAYLSFRFDAPFRYLFLAMVISIGALSLVSSDIRAYTTTFGRVWLWWPLVASFLGAKVLDAVVTRYKVMPIGVLGAGLILTGFFMIAWQMSFSTMLVERSTLTPETWRVIQDVKTHASGSSAIVTAPESLGWHVKRVVNMPVHTVDPLNDATPAGCVFGMTDCDVARTVQELNIDYIIVKTGNTAQYWQRER